MGKIAFHRRGVTIRSVWKLFHAGSSPVIRTKGKRPQKGSFFFGKKQVTGLEGERADQREAKTVRWTVFSERVDQLLFLHTPQKTR